MKLNTVAVVSKFDSKESEDAGRKVAKKLLGKKAEVYTIAPVSVEGAKQVESVEELRNKNLLDGIHCMAVHYPRIFPKLKDIIGN